MYYLSLSSGFKSLKYVAYQLGLPLLVKVIVLPDGSDVLVDVDKSPKDAMFGLAIVIELIPGVVVNVYGGLGVPVPASPQYTLYGSYLYGVINGLGVSIGDEYVGSSLTSANFSFNRVHCLGVTLYS